MGSFWDSAATLLYVPSYRKSIFRETSFLHSEANSDGLVPVVNRTQGFPPGTLNLMRYTLVLAVM
jgi:hypothetical protein